MFKTLSEGFVYHTEAPDRSAAGPRSAVLADGTLVCSYMVQTDVGINDFVPMLSFSGDGEHWSEGVPAWPEWIGKKSAFVSVRPMADGRYSLAGKWFPIHQPGESFWSDEAGGMKENELIFSISPDGRSFPAPSAMKPPFYASAEQPGGLFGDEDGSLTMIYAPYPTIEKREPVITSRLVKLRSTDGGKSFVPSVFGEAEKGITYAESWLCRLSDGRLMAASWMLGRQDGDRDVFFLSDDNGETFDGPHLCPFNGQTMSLTPWEDGTVLIPYNQRREGDIGVWLALAKPEGNTLRLLENQPVWLAQTSTRKGSSGEFSEWTDFSFGEPHVCILPDGGLLLTFWCSQPGGKGIRFVRLHREA